VGAGKLGHGPAWPQAELRGLVFASIITTPDTVAGLAQCAWAQGVFPWSISRRVPKVVTMKAQGHMQAKGPSLFSVLSSYRAGVVQDQASPQLWTSLLALVMCSFGGRIGCMLARPAWPWSLFPMPAARCAAGNWFAQRSVAQRVDLITSVLGRAPCTSVFNLAAACYRTVQPTGSLQFAVVLEACSFCIEPQRGLLPQGLFSPGITSISCGGS
jgi:hypothetical protein